MYLQLHAGRIPRRRPRFYTGLEGIGKPRIGLPGIGLWLLIGIIYGLVHCVRPRYDTSCTFASWPSQQFGDEDGIRITAVSATFHSTMNFQEAHEETQAKLNIILEGIQALVEACQQKFANPTPFPPYNHEHEDWDSYERRLRQHFEAFGIKNESLQRSWFLSWIAPAQYQLLGKLSPMVEPCQLTFTQICALLQKYYEWKTHVITARLEFYNCLKKPTQSYRSWAAELQGLAKRCRFQTASGESYSDSMIRDAIIRNSPDRSFHLQALQLDDPTTEELLNLAQAFVISREAGRQVEHWGKSTSRPLARLTTKDEPMDTDYTGRPPRPDQRRPGPSARPPEPWKPTQKRRQLPSCSACFAAHPRAQCPHRWAVCTGCGRRGHRSDVCQQTTGPEDADQDAVSEAPTLNIHSHMRYEANRIFITLRVNNKDVELQVDTGSVASIINYETYVRLGAPL